MNEKDEENENGLKKGINRFFSFRNKLNNKVEELKDYEV